MSYIFHINFTIYKYEGFVGKSVFRDFEERRY
jgi:hypothetical protein